MNRNPRLSVLTPRAQQDGFRKVGGRSIVVDIGLLNSKGGVLAHLVASIVQATNAKPESEGEDWPEGESTGTEHEWACGDEFGVNTDMAAAGVESSLDAALVLWVGRVQPKTNQDQWSLLKAVLDDRTKWYVRMPDGEKLRVLFTSSLGNNPVNAVVDSVDVYLLPQGTEVSKLPA